jgi:DNA-binding transcriptional MerR regulator
MSIGDVARQTGLAVSAIRFYEEKGLLPRAARRSGKRVYDDSVLDRLALIETAKSCGCSLQEITTLLTDSGGDASERWRSLAAAKLAELDALQKRIALMRRTLRRMMQCGCRTTRECGHKLRNA